MIDLLITVIFLAIVFGLIYYLITLLPLPAPFATIVQIAMVLICILIVLGVAFGGVNLPLTHWRR